MVNNRLFWFLLFLLIVLKNTKASPFEKGTQEFGLSNIGIGYSNVSGMMVSANTRYQYYLFNRFSAGGSVFYNNFNDHEWMGLGPVASYIFFTTPSWFGRLDQQVIAAKFNGFSDKMSSFYASSGISVNYMPPMTNFFIGGGYVNTYALNDGRILRPNAIQILAGWLWQ